MIKQLIKNIKWHTMRPRYNELKSNNYKKALGLETYQFLKT